MTVATARALPEPTETCDVIVIGGGPAGSAAALRLAAQGFHVIQLERRTYYAPTHDPLRSGEGVIPQTLGELAQLGIDIQSPAWALSSVHHLAVRWPTGSTTRDTFPGTRAITLINRECFDATLFSSAQKRGVDGRQGWRVQRLLQNDAGAIHGVLALTPEGEHVTLRATLVIDGGGRNARSITQFALRHTLSDPQFLVIVHYLDTLPDLAPETWELHFFGDTPMAVLQITQLEAGLVRCALGTIQSAKSKHAGRPDETFDHCLRQYPAFVTRLRASHQVRPAYARAALAYAVHPIALLGLLLVGDATGYLNPLLGDGIWAALRSAALASEVAAQACRTGDVSLRQLDVYARRWTAQRRIRWLITRVLVRSLHHPSLLLAPAYVMPLRHRLLRTLLRD